MDVLAATLFYDSIIALIVAVIPLFFVELWRRWPKIKRRREYEIVSVLLAIVWLVIFYGSFIAPKILRSASIRSASAGPASICGSRFWPTSTWESTATPSGSPASSKK